MGRDGAATRRKILTESKTLVLNNGFSGTSIDQILEKTGITKGAFFYHFKTKNDLARALMEKFAEEDMSHMEWALQETEQQKDVPLDRLLQFIQLFIDMMSNLKDPHPGCLYASYNHESNSFDEETMHLISDTILAWRNTMESLIKNVLKDYDMVLKEDTKSLADAFTVIFEGGFILSKTLNEADLTAKQLKHLKNYFQLLFVPKK